MNTFLPHVDHQRALLGYGGPAHIIMDGCRAHLSDEVLDLFHQGSVEVHILPPYSSDQTQPLALRIFSILKGAQRIIHPQPWVSRQTAQVLRILGAMTAVTTPPNVISAFAQAGIMSRWNMVHGCLTCYVNSSEARAIRIAPIQASDSKKRITLESIASFR